MNIIEYKDGFFIENDKYFDPFLTFDCGQCFRFNSEDGTITGVAFGKVITIEKVENGYYISGSGKLDFNVLSQFLDCDNSYDEIEAFLKSDSIIAPALSFGRGIRILKQEFLKRLFLL